MYFSPFGEASFHRHTTEIVGGMGSSLTLIGSLIRPLTICHSISLVGQDTFIWWVDRIKIYMSQTRPSVRKYTALWLQGFSIRTSQDGVGGHSTCLTSCCSLCDAPFPLAYAEFGLQFSNPYKSDIPELRNVFAQCSTCHSTTECHSWCRALHEVDAEWMYRQTYIQRKHHLLLNARVYKSTWLGGQNSAV